jgi:hypothetical protein
LWVSFFILLYFILSAREDLLIHPDFVYSCRLFILFASFFIQLDFILSASEDLLIHSDFVFLRLEN